MFKIKSVVVNVKIFIFVNLSVYAEESIKQNLPA